MVESFDDKLIERNYLHLYDMCLNGNLLKCCHVVYIMQIQKFCTVGVLLCALLWNPLVTHE